MSVIELNVGGTHLRAHAVQGFTGLSRLFSFQIEASLAADPPELADLIGQTFTLKINDARQTTLPVHGLVMSGERRALAQGGAVFHLELEPEVGKLAVGQDSRVFQEMTAIEIVKKVLAKAGIDAAGVRWATTGSYPKRPYCAQYRESDWIFIERLLAEEGIYYWFELTDDATKLVFADDSTGATEIDGGAEVPYRGEGSLVATGDSVNQISRSSTHRSSMVRLRDYNFEKPRLDLDSKAGSGKLEMYDFPGRFQVPAEGDRLARVRLEALRATRTVVSGGSSSARLRAGLIFAITDHPAASLNARYLLDTVDYSADERGGLDLFFRAIPAATPWRVPGFRHTTGPGGPQTGVVVGGSGEEIHPDATGRIRVQFYWDREGKKDDKASTWMRVGQFALGGSMVLPRIGWDVMVNHHEGDVDHPLVTSHLYDGQFPVPYALPANKTRTAWQTATTPGGGSTNEIRFEDKAGGEEMFLNASKDMNVVIGDNKQEKVGVDHTHKIGANHDVKIGSNLKINILGKQSVTIGASEKLSVSATRTMTVGGSETTKIGASRTTTVIKGLNISAKAGRKLTVGGSMTSVSAMGVTRTAIGSLSIKVGGAWISAAATGLANMTGGASAETVGGAKIYAGATGCETGVKGALAETVGGAYVITAGSNVGESSTGPLAITVGGAFLANAPEIEIEGESEISIRCGATSIKITSSSVEVKAPLIAAPGAVITKKASTIKHN